MLLAVACLATPLRAQVPGGFEQGVYDLRVGRAAGVTSPVLVTVRGAVLVPVDRVIALTGLPEPVRTNDSVRATPVVGTTRAAVLDLRAGQILRDGEVHPIASDEAAVVDGQIYLAPARLAEWLGARVVEDRENLVITFSRTPPFPVEQQVTTRERRAAYGSRVGMADSARAAVPWVARSGGVAAEWNLSLPSADLARNAALQLQVGGALFGGGFQAGSTVSSRRGLDAAELSRSWRYAYVNPLSPLLRSVEIGNLGTATSYRAIRGIAISNVQPFRNGFFASVPVIPDVPAGWSYEIYQNGVLLGFSDGAQQTAVPVPLYYGSTPVELRFLGPAGEEVTRAYVYQVVGQQLPPGAVEYAIGAGSCPAAAKCRQVSYANLAYGIRPWMTVSAGAELVDSLGRRGYPYARALLAMPSGYNARVELTPQIRSASVAFLGLGRLAASLSAGETAAGAAVASFVDATRSRRFLEPSLVFPLRGEPLGIRALRVEGRVEQPAGRSMDRIRATHSAHLPRGQYGLHYDRDPLQRLGFVSASGTSLVPLRVHRWSGLVPVQTDAAFTRRGLQRVSLGTMAGNGQNRSVSATVRWLRPQQGFSLVISYNAFLGRFRQSAAVFATPRRAIATTVLGGTAVYDRRNGLAQSDRFGINTAGVTGRVFFDEDADGRYSSADRPAADARVIADAGATRTDAEGRYRLWGLLPYEPTRVVVDTLQGIDLAYAPATPESRLRPTPNLFNPVDIPLLRTRELVGQVEGWAEMAAGGIGLELRDVTTGKVREVITFNDGAFYMSRVPPGRYEWRIAESSLRALRAQVVTPCTPRV
ncbi:MAG: hypothetical protein ACYC1Z_14060, partial [Georgenia sp.]